MTEREIVKWGTRSACASATHRGTAQNSILEANSGSGYSGRPPSAVFRMLEMSKSVSFCSFSIHRP
jgi:hypothetical protein